MRRLVSVAVCVLAVALAAAPTRAATERDAFTAVKAAKAPPLDATLTDPVWATAVLADRFTTISSKARSAYATDVRVLYDATNIYVGIHAEQRGTPITATQTANNLGFGVDDFVGIGLDTSGNGAQSYFFFTTPNGTRYQSANENARYTPQWTAKTLITADGWNAILVIPLAILKTNGASVQGWRFNAVRRIAATNTSDTWAFNGIMQDGAFPSLGDARFWPALSNIALGSAPFHPHGRAEIYGLGALGGDRHQFARADGSFAPTGTRPTGIDASFAIAPTVSLVGTLAPDFSNVEVDQQTIAPQEFRRALAEYRPFFSQGAEFFNPVSLNGINSAPNQIFFSPNIGPFDRGLKLEGTEGFQSFGALETKGSGFDDTVIAYKHRTPDRTFSWSLDGAFVRHNAGNETYDPRAAIDNTVQAEVAGRDNRTGFVYEFEYTAERGTFVTNPGLATKSEDFIDIHKPNYEVFLSYRAIGPQYGPIDGYTGDPDIRGPQAFFDLNGAIFGLKRADLFITGDRYLDRSGAVHQADAFASVSLTTKGLLSLSGGPSTSELRTYDSGLVGYPLYTGGITTSYNGHFVDLGYRDGTPAPIDASYQWGPYGGSFVQLGTLSTSRTFGKRFSIAAEIDGTRMRPLSGDSNGQWLRRLTFGENIDANTNVSIALRTISGTGGFSSPGTNLAASFHRRFRNDSELFIDYGTPAANQTLQRLLVKYLIRTGGAAGT